MKTSQNMPFASRCAFVYMHTNILTGKSYVGLTTRTVRERWTEHVFHALKSKEHRNVHLYRSIRKHGPDCWLHSTLQTCHTLIEAKQAERYWIKELGTKVDGYNLTDGGDGQFGHSPTEETREKIRRALVGIKRSEETRRKLVIAQSHRGPVSDLTRMRQSKAQKKVQAALTQEQKAKRSQKARTLLIGRKVSNETRERIRKSNLGRVFSEQTLAKLREARNRRGPYSKETCRKISEGNKGKKVSEEAKERMRQSARNRPPPSEETRRRTGEANRRRGAQSAETIAKRSSALCATWKKRKETGAI